MAFVNVIDNASTTVSASTPGITVDLRHHTTKRLLGVGVPVRFKVCVHSAAANDTGAVKLVDENGVALITVLINGGVGEKWYWAEGYLPATLAKYDLHFGGNTLGSLTMLSASCYEIDWTTDPITGVAELTLGPLASSGEGGFRGDANLTLGALGVAAVADGHGDAAITLDALSITAEGTVVSPMPAFKAIGTQASGTGAVSPAWPTHVANDRAVLWVIAQGSTDPGPATLSTAAGFVAVTGGSSVFNNGANYVRCTVFECRATSGAMGAPTVADNHANVLAIISTYTDCSTGASAVDVVGTGGGVGTSLSVAGNTTTGGNRLVAVGLGNGTSFAAYSSWANASLSSVTSRGTFNGFCGFGIADGEKAAAGAFGATTATLDVVRVWAGVAIALKP